MKTWGCLFILYVAFSSSKEVFSLFSIQCNVELWTSNIKGRRLKHFFKNNNATICKITFQASSDSVYSKLFKPWLFDITVLAILFFYKLCCKYGLSGAVVVRKICSDTHPIFTAFFYYLLYLPFEKVFFLRRMFYTKIGENCPSGYREEVKTQDKR